MNSVQNEDAPEDVSAIKSKGISAVKSNYVGLIIRVAGQFFSQIFIMRNLGPELVGTFAYVLFLYGVLALVIDQGFGWSLIHTDFDDSEEIATVFSRIMLVAVGSAFFVFLLSFPASYALRSELVGKVFRLSAPSYLLIGLFVVSQARMRAELRFGEIQRCLTVAYIVAYPVVGVLLAVSGFGVWSLLIAWNVQMALQVAIGFRFSPYALKFCNPFRNTKCGRLGLKVAGINLVNWTVDNSSAVFVGTMGPSLLGGFNAASLLARTPAFNLVMTLQSVIFSTASAVKQDEALVRKMYISSLAAITFFLFPLYAYIASHSVFIVELLFGQKWDSAANALAPLSVGMIALATSSLSGPVLTAIGAGRVVLYSQCICLFLLAAGMAILPMGNVFYMSLNISAAYICGLFIHVVALVHKKIIGYREVAVAVRGPVILAIVFIPTFTVGVHEIAMRCIIETCFFVAKILLSLYLVRAFPKFFICDALMQIIKTSKFGRRMLYIASID